MRLIQKKLHLKHFRETFQHISNLSDSSFPVSSRQGLNRPVWTPWLWILGHSERTGASNWPRVGLWGTYFLDFGIHLKRTSWFYDLKMRPLRTTCRLTPWSQGWREGKMEGAAAQRGKNSVVTRVTGFWDLDPMRDCQLLLLGFVILYSNKISLICLCLFEIFC